MHIEALASQVSDNFFYVLFDEDHAWFVDPIDHQQAAQWIDARSLTLKGILNTHWHPDHVGGNVPLRAAFPDLMVYAPRSEQEAYEGVTQERPDVLLEVGQTLTLGGQDLKVLSAPGHTHGHVIFSFDEHCISGDVLFDGGAGNCRFGGDPGVSFQTYRDVLRPLPPTTHFYPGHDYTEKNLAMAHDLLPDDEHIAQALAQARARTPRTFYPVVLSEQLRTNLFLRYDDPRLVEALGARFEDDFAAQGDLSQSQDEQVWRMLRHLRNTWSGQGFS